MNSIANFFSSFFRGVKFSLAFLHSSFLVSGFVILAAGVSAMGAYYYTDNPAARAVLIAISILCVLYECSALLKVRSAYAERDFSRIGLTLSLLAFATVYTALMQFHFFSFLLSENKTVRIAQIDGHAQIVAQRDNIQRQLSWIPKQLPTPAVIESQILVAKNNVPATTLRRTNGCTDVTQPRSMKQCKPVIQLQADLTASKERVRLAQELSAINKRLAAMKAPKAVDAKADALRAATGLEGEWISLAMLALGVIILQFGQVSIAYIQMPPNDRPTRKKKPRSLNIPPVKVTKIEAHNDDHLADKLRENASRLGSLTGSLGVNEKVNQVKLESADILEFKPREKPARLSSQEIFENWCDENIVYSRKRHGVTFKELYRRFKSDEGKETNISDKQFFKLIRASYNKKRIFKSNRGWMLNCEPFEDDRKYG